jgi:hypothetical protein
MLSESASGDRAWKLRRGRRNLQDALIDGPSRGSVQSSVGSSPRPAADVMAAARVSARVEARPRATMLPGLPMRGNSHLIIFRYGSPLDGSRSIAFLAKGLACSSVCRLSFGSDIHSRMILRRVSSQGRRPSRQRAGTLR